MKSSESSWTLTSAISKYISEKLKRVLRPYLENPNIETQVSFKPEIALSDIMMREDALDQLVLPISVTKQSRVSLLKVTLPLTSYNSLPVTVELTKVRIYVEPNENTWTNAGRSGQKFKKLDEWKEEQKSEFKEMEKKGFLAKLKHTVVNNFKLLVRDVELVYMDTKSMGYPCFIRIYIGRLDVETVNSSWKPEFSRDESATYRLVTLHDFSIAVISDPPDDRMRERMGLYEFYHDTGLSERHYVLKPCNITIKHRMSHTDPLTGPWQQIEAEIAGLEISLSETQFQFIKNCLNYFDFKRSYSKYQKFRPLTRVTDNPRVWWDYLINASRLDSHASIITIYENKQKMERYVDLFKRHQDIIHSPWLQQLKKGEIDELHAYEEQVPLNDLLFYRTLALYHLRIEAMHYVRAKGNVKGITHLGDLWDYYLNDFESLLGDPNQQVSREEEVEMNRTESQELMVLTTMDKQQALKSLLSGKSSTAHDQTFDIQFSIPYFFLYIQKTSAISRENHQFFDQEKCTCKLCKKDPARELSINIVRAGSFGRNLTGIQREKRIVMPLDEKEGLLSSDSDDESRKRVPRKLLPEHRNHREYNISSGSSKDIERVTHKHPDERLLTEHTLLIIHLDRISGKLGVLRNGKVWTDPSMAVKVSNMQFWDPMALRDSDLRLGFLRSYGFTNLLDDLIEKNVNDAPAFYSLRHFMRLSGLLSSFEFYVHHKETTFPTARKGLAVEKTARRYCSCGVNYTSESLFETCFKDATNQNFIHMPEEERPMDVAGMEIVAQKIEKQFLEGLLPFYIRRCARWVMPSTVPHVLPLEEVKSLPRRVDRRSGREYDSAKTMFTLSFEFEGEKNPIEVQFGEEPEILLAEQMDMSLSQVVLHLESPSFVLTNTTVSEFIQWLNSEDIETEVFSKEPLTTSFRERVKRMKPELCMVSDFYKQAQKDVKHLYNYMLDQVQSNRELEIVAVVRSLRISLLDEKNIEKYVYPPIVSAMFDKMSMHFKTRAKGIEDSNIQEDRPRHGLNRDLKFYQKLDLDIENFAVTAMNKELAKSALHLTMCKCLVPHHPELPDLVLDVHVPELVLQINSALLPLLSFLNNIDFDGISKLSRQTEETEDRRNVINLGFEPLFRVDMKRTRNLLKKLNKEHFKGKSPCRHCQMLYIKHRKLIYFSLGAVDQAQGLAIQLVPDLVQNPSLTFRVPVIVFAFQEKCFLKTASLLVSQVIVEEAQEERIEISVQNTNESVFPVIPAKVFQVLTYLKETLNALESTNIDDEHRKRYREMNLQELLVMRQHINPEIYTEKEWDYREGEYLRNKSEKLHTVFAEPDLKSLAKSKHVTVEPTSMTIRYSADDYIYVK